MSRRKRPSWYIDWKKMAEIVPEGKVGNAEVIHFTVSEEDSKRTHLQAILSYEPSSFVPPGRYARLMVGEHLMMSDTQMEQDTNSHAVIKANGSVLIAGMGSNTRGTRATPGCRNPGRGTASWGEP